MAAWRLSPQAPPACVNFKLIGDLRSQSARGVWSVGGLGKRGVLTRCLAIVDGEAVNGVAGRCRIT